MAWTADDLLTAIRLRCRIPDGGSVASDVELLTVANDQIATVFSPLMRQVQEEYGIQTTDTAVSASSNEYDLPARCTAAALRDVVLYNSQTQVGLSLPRVGLEDVDRYQAGGSAFWRAGAAFAVQGDRLILLPANHTPASTLRLRWHLRPSKLVLTTNTTYCNALATVTSTTAMTTSVSVPDQTVVDVVSAVTPTADLLAVDDVANTVGDSVTLTNGCRTIPAVGDYICTAGYSPIVPLPAELHPVLVTACSVSVWEMLRDLQAMDVAAKRLGSELAQARTLLTPRVDGEAPRIINRNGALRGKRGGGWR